MPVTNTFTTTRTFTQTQIVLMQYRIAFDYAGVLSEERVDNILWAIESQAVAAVGIYACDGNRQRVAEVEISVDWEKHNQIVKLSGGTFDYFGGGFNRSTGEASETKRCVNTVVKLAQDRGYQLGCWVRPVPGLPKPRWDEVCARCGLGGQLPAWSGPIAADHTEEYLAIPQMQAVVRLTDL